MSRTPLDRKIAAIGALVEGASLRAVSRMTGLSRTRLSRLVLEMGRASERLLEERIRGFHCEQIECDELWTFVHKRRARVRPGDSPEAGNAWIWSGVDPDSKIVPAHHVGGRMLEDAYTFARQLRKRIEGDVQLNTDRLHAYRAAIWGEFSTWNEAEGDWDRPDWGTIVKHYETPEVRDQGRYVPPRLARADRRVESGSPNPDRISTSHVEAHHLHFRMRNRRVARMTNAVSKSLRHLRAATAIYYAHYNWVRKHSTVRTTPAVAAGLEENPWNLGDFVEWGEIFGRV